MIEEKMMNKAYCTPLATKLMLPERPAMENM
jgi:hypothetical protein